MGDRIAMIESACWEMRQNGLKIVRTSSLYETQAMYVEDQNAFVNGVCEVRALVCCSIDAGERGTNDLTT